GRIGDVALDARMVAFTLGVALATGVAFGLIPALQASQLDLHESLKAGERSIGEPRRRRARQALLATEVALSLALLVGAGLLLKSFVSLRAVDPGFNPRNLTLAGLALPAARYPQEQEQVTFYRELLLRAQNLPGARAAAVATPLPFSQNRMTLKFIRDDRPPPPPDQPSIAGFSTVSPGYFETLEIPIRSGRTFTRADDQANAPPVVIINQTMARQFFAGENPVGKRITIGAAAYNQT